MLFAQSIINEHFVIRSKNKILLKGTCKYEVVILFQWFVPLMSL